MIRSTFAIPALLALLSLVGLVLALTGEGWRDQLSWAALCVPLASVIWAVARNSPPKDPSK
jgi:hypothetical protein